jgi:hypothetical protein
VAAIFGDPWLDGWNVLAAHLALQTKRQLEEDADREIEELKDKYEQRLAAEREVRDSSHN